jgi:hypothetical protein
MNTMPANARSPFKTPVRLLVISLGMMLLWAIGMIVFGGAPLKALLQEMGKPGPTEPEVMGAILEKFFRVEIIVTGTIGGIGMILFQAAVAWILVVLIVRASRG